MDCTNLPQTHRKPLIRGVCFLQDKARRYLPLEQVIASVNIVDVSATVKLTQEFWNYSSDKIPSASYVFPVPARAAVCGFEMRSQDGKKIKAVAKEKEQAHKEYTASVEQGRTAGLIEHATDDVFRISLGALPARQLLTTTITYVMDLMDADISDQVRFHLPLVVGERYGQLPEGMQGARALNSRRVEINVDVRMKDTIRSITSPSHTITHRSNANATTLQSINFQSAQFLKVDFVLAIKADGLDIPRCFAEAHPTGTTALQLTMVPKFNFPPIPVQEYIFVIDRSGSMLGTRIETAKNTLIMLLRSLPARGTSFNVFQFSYECSSLWGESVQYSEETLAKASEYVERILARGGTAIESALEQAFRSRNSHIPTACFVLTDGEAYDTLRTFKAVADAVAASKQEAPLRVFTLGIGNRASTEMCEGIARLGNGICHMAVESESIVDKTAKLLRASRTYPLTDVTIDWGSGFAALPDLIAQTNVFRQTPERIPSIYASNRFIIYALVKHANFVVPDRVVIRAQQNRQEKIYSFEVPVERLPVTMDVKETHLIHTLAARRVIQELDDRNKTTQDPEMGAKEAIIHLGEQYQLASRYTSFIAVEKRTLPKTDKAPEPTSIDDDFVIVKDQDWFKSDTFLFQGTDEDEDEDLWCKFTAPRPMASVMLPPPPADPLPTVLSMMPAMPLRPQPSQGRPQKTLQAGRPIGVAPAISMGLQSFTEKGSGGFALDGGLADLVATANISVVPQPSDTSPVACKPQGVDSDVVGLVRLQSFDGSFRVSPELEAIFGKGALAEGPKIGIDQTIWATVLAAAYLQKHISHQPELLEGLLDKARDFVNGTPGADFEEVLQKAKLVLME